MKSIQFNGANQVIAESQDEYQTVIGHIGNTPIEVEGKMVEYPCTTLCMELSQEEVDELIKTRKIWYVQVGMGLHPFNLSVTKPELKERK